MYAGMAFRAASLKGRAPCPEHHLHSSSEHLILPHQRCAALRDSFSFLNLIVQNPNRAGFSA